MMRFRWGRRPTLHRLVGLVFILALSTSAFARVSDRYAAAGYVPGRVIVRFTPAAAAAFTAADRAASGTLRSGVRSLDAACQELSVTSARRLVTDAQLAPLRTAPDLQTCYLLQLGDGVSVLDAIDRLAADPHIVHVEPDLLRRVSRVPNDPLWESQWDKRIMGAPAAWSYSTGARNIICAGIDTGVDWNHPDLTPSLWINPGEDVDGDSIPWTDPTYPGDFFTDVNGIDDDGNGFIDDLLGWDFVTDVGNCTPGEDCDDQPDNDMAGTNDHGTHIAGIMAASGNNAAGVAGMVWTARLMALRAGYNSNDGMGYIPTSASVQAILYAAANGARVINMSYGAESSSSLELETLTAAWNQGCLLFAASGNDGDSAVQYPAAAEDVIAVNATDHNDRLAHWSNRGGWTDICAPGASPGIVSTVIDGYGSQFGTSMASPIAAGAAALLWSLFPALSNSELRDLLLNSAADITADNPTVPPEHLGRGRVDLSRALATRFPQLLVTTVTVNDTLGGDGDGRLEAGETAALTLAVANSPGWSTGYDVSALIAATEPGLSISGGPWPIGLIAAGQSAANGLTPFALSLSADFDTVYDAALRITFSAPGGYREEEEFVLRLGRAPVLLVDDDGGRDYESFYADALEQLATPFDPWSVAADSSPAVSGLAQHRAVLWICGDESTATLTAADQAALGTYLDGGGTLLLVGQNIDEDLRGTPFYSAYLHAAGAAARGDSALAGVSGDPVAGGRSLLLLSADCARNGLLGPSRIEPLGAARPLFTYAGGGTGALRFEGAYRLLYFAFALEAACGDQGTTHFRDVIDAALAWSGALPVADPRPAPLPAAVTLHPNYPNPFNPVTTIAFDLPAALSVRLRVYDLLGRSVATLLDAPLAAGAHRVSFNGAGLASGTYLVRLEAGAAVRSQKMVLLK